MKKIYFNDRFGMSACVIVGLKSQVRVRAESGEPLPWREGEMLAVAQSYRTLAGDGHLNGVLSDNANVREEYAGRGWTNRGCVKAELMPHHVLVVRVRMERLQQISDDDCLAEGVVYRRSSGMYGFTDALKGDAPVFTEPAEAFAAMVDRACGAGTWASDPMVAVYEFIKVD